MASTTFRSTMFLSLVLLLLQTLLPHTSAKSLTRFASCEALNDYFQGHALSRVGPYGFGRPPVFRRGGGGFGGPRPLPRLQAFDSPLPNERGNVPTGITPVAGEDFSDTNVQVSGVDEPDVIKTDGKSLYVIRGTNFFVVDVGPFGASGKVRGRLSLPTNGQEMLIEGNSVLVIGRDYTSSNIGPRSFFFRPAGQPTTIVYQINVAGKSPVLVSTLKMSGNYVSAREVSGTARLVLTYDPTPLFKFTFPSGSVTSDQATAANKNIITSTDYKSWLPTYSVESKKCTDSGCSSSISTGNLGGCSRTFRSTGAFTGFKLLTVVTLPVSGFISPSSSVSISSDGDTVYSTAKSLYVTTTDYQGDYFGFESNIRWGRAFRTSLHKFRLNKRKAKYVASGEVSGSVLNQFSMHEYKNVFFVATTDGAPWWIGRDVSKSKLTSFRARARVLNQIGEVGNLGIGERIYSVRYIEDTAYVVTFRQVDPLYIIDLSDPRSLKATGELKIPGFSSYLHPVGPGRLLGVGQEATPEGRTTGAKVSLFDVSNKRIPRQLASWTLEGSYTTAQWDHRAFLYWQPEEIAVLPISVYNSVTRFTGSIVLDISPSSISLRGRITHEACCGRSVTPGIERNVVIARDHLWSLSWQALQVNSIKTLAFESSVALSTNPEA